MLCVVAMGSCAGVSGKRNRSLGVVLVFLATLNFLSMLAAIIVYGVMVWNR